MKKNKLIFTLIQVGVLIATAGGFIFFQNAQVAPTQAYVFTRDIPANTEIQKGDLKKITIPKDGIQSNFVTDINDIVGKAVSSKAYANQYVISNQIIDVEDVDVFEQMDLSN